MAGAEILHQLCVNDAPTGPEILRLCMDDAPSGLTLLHRTTPQMAGADNCARTTPQMAGAEILHQLRVNDAPKGPKILRLCKVDACTGLRFYTNFA